MYRWCDLSSHIIGWSSEEIGIRYVDENDGSWHTYFPDVLIHVKSENGIKIFLVEIKPLKEKEKPIPPKRYTPKSKANYIKRCQLYVKNQSKWKYAREYCRQRNWEFIVLTEVELGIKR